MTQFTALHFSYPYLFVGTSKGDLIVFRIQKNNFTSGAVGVDHGQRSWEYKVLTAEHCGPIPVLDIFATPLRTEDEECRSLFHSSVATPTSLQVLVVCGQSPTDFSSVSSSKVFFYEVITSPAPSPLTSPMQLPSRPMSGFDRRCSSVASNSSTTSLRRRSIGSFDGGLPKLSLYSASPSALSLLPLRSS